MNQTAASNRMMALIDRGLSRLPAYVYAPRRTDRRPTWKPSARVFYAGTRPYVRNDMPAAALSDAKGRLLPRRVRRERSRAIAKKVAELKRLGVVHG